MRVRVASGPTRSMVCLLLVHCSENALHVNPSEETILVGPLTVRFLLTGDNSISSIAAFELIVPGEQAWRLQRIATTITPVTNGSTRSAFDPRHHAYERPPPIPAASVDAFKAARSETSPRNNLLASMVGA
jgi:hypothetical protein